MKTIRLYYHPDCPGCTRMARLDQRLDWLNRLEVSTHFPGPVPLRAGEIAVQDLRTGGITKGTAAFRQLCQHLPLYAPLIPLLAFPFVRRWLDQKLSGCAGDGCRVSRSAGPATKDVRRVSAPEMSGKWQPSKVAYPHPSPRGNLPR